MAATLALLGLLGGLLGGPISASKTQTVIADPLNGVLAPKAIPGAVVEYAITVTNTSLYALDSGAVVVADAIPPKTKLYVSDLAGAGSGPVATAQGAVSSGLSTVYTSLASTTDDLDFSSDGGTSYAYTPTPDASGCDPAVTNIRIRTRGVGAVGGVYKVRFRVVVK